MGRDDFHEGLGASWEEGQAGVRFSIKTFVLRGTVTWIGPQLSVPRTHIRPRIQMKGDFSVETLKDFGCRSNLPLGTR